MQTMHLPLLLCLMTVPPCSTSNSFLMTGSVIRELLCHRLWHMNIFHYSWAVPQGILRRYWGKRLWGSHSGADWTSLQVGDPPIGLEPSLVFVASYSSGCGWKCALAAAAASVFLAGCSGFCRLRPYRCALAACIAKPVADPTVRLESRQSVCCESHCDQLALTCFCWIGLLNIRSFAHKSRP